MNFLATLMADKFVEDARAVDHHLSVPGLGVFGLSLPILLFWVQLAMVRKHVCSCWVLGGGERMVTH